LPTSAVPSMTAAVSVKVPETPRCDRARPPNSGLAPDWRLGAAQHLPLKVSPWSYSCRVEQIGVAAEDLAIRKHDHPAAFADSSILQADMIEYRPFFMTQPVYDIRHGGVGTLLCQSGCVASTRQVDRGTAPNAGAPGNPAVMTLE